jgi:2-methylcitrate dehydratase PrpD
MSSDPITSLELTERLVALEAVNLSEDDIAQLKRLILDYAAVTLCGAAQPWGRKLRAWAESQGEGGRARLFGARDFAPAAAAALVNGTAAHGYELDDTHEGSSSHPGAVVITAALAVAAERENSGAQVLAAIAAGYEAMTLIGKASISTEVTEYGFHATCLFGPFGAATAAAKLMGLDAAAMARAWGLALSMVGGSAQFAFEPEGTMVKRTHAGIPAQHGVIAAQLAALGITAPVQALEGEFGFYNLYAKNPNLDLLRKPADAALEIHNVSFKPYSCCRKFHSLIDGLEEVTDGFAAETKSIAAIDVHSPGNAIKKHMMRRPDSVMAAQYSMPYIVGATLAFGPRRYDAYESVHHRDADILGLIDKVEAHHDPDLDSYVPGKMPNRVEVRFADGRSRKARVIEALGSPGRPLSFEGVMEKARPLMAMTDPDINLDAIAVAVNDLSEAESVTHFTDTLIFPNDDTGDRDALAAE